MFDTFDLLVPKLLLGPQLRVEQRESAFGVDEAKYAYLGEIKLGQTMVARDAFTAIEAWTGAPGREDWTVLLLRPEANAAAQNDDTWREFLGAIVTVLEAHATWRVTCESDCDQHPVERLELTPEALVALLDRYREGHFFPIAFCSEAVAAAG